MNINLLIAAGFLVLFNNFAPDKWKGDDPYITTKITGAMSLTLLIVAVSG